MEEQGYFKDYFCSPTGSKLDNVMTVSIYHFNDKVSRGVALRSATDEPDEIKGKSLSRARAVLALFSEKNGERLQISGAVEEVLLRLVKTPSKFPEVCMELFADRAHTGFYNAVYNPILSEFEKGVSFDNNS